MKAKRRSFYQLWWLLLVLAAGLTLAAATVVVANPQFEVVASGLDNPRHLRFGPDGALYVAEAGTGSFGVDVSGGGFCIDGPEGGTVCYGATGAVTKVEGETQTRVVSGLASLADPATGDSAGGIHDVVFDDAGNLYGIVGLGADPAARDSLGPNGMDFGQLIAIDPISGTWSNQADVSAYEAEQNPDGDGVDSNPFGLNYSAGYFLVADSGGNDLLKVDLGGDILVTPTISTLAVFSDTLVEFPPGSGDMIPMQAVPTAVAMGPDGAYYVSQLTGFPFPVGGASIWRVEEGSDPTVYATGFTNVLDLAFDADDNLYVLEMATNGLLSGDPTGKVIRVYPNGVREELASEGLVFPTGMALGPDGDVYVTNNTFFAGIGEVVRISAAPTSVSLTSFGGNGGLALPAWLPALALLFLGLALYGWRRGRAVS